MAGSGFDMSGDGGGGGDRSRIKFRVLVVEDDVATYNAMRTLLHHYEYDVLLARSVAEGLTHLGQSPRFVLLDLMLPDGTGTSVLEEVRSRGMNSRVYVITSVTDPAMLRRVEALRPEAVLRKPLDFVRLLQQMKTVVGHDQ